MLDLPRPTHAVLAFALSASACLDAHEAQRAAADVAARADVGPDVGGATDPASGADVAEVSDVASSADVGGSPDVADVPPAPSVDLCRSVGTLDFRVTGSGFEAFEGLAIQAAAVQPIQPDPPLEPALRPVVVRLSGVIRDGAFALACPDSLVENLAYPAWAVFIDVDRDGRCGGDDLGLEWQLYGWLYDVEAELGPAADPEPDQVYPWQPVGAIQSWGGPFCEAYGFGAPPAE